MKITELIGGRKEIGKSILVYNNKHCEMISVLPLIGPNSHENVMTKIDSQKFIRPTTAQTLFLLDLAYKNPNDPHCKEILSQFKQDYLWTSTENMSFSDGVIVYDNFDGKMPTTSKGLMKLVEAGDKRVRFVQEDFKTGLMPMKDFLNHPYTIAQVGDYTIPILKKVATQSHKKEAYVFGIPRTDSDTKSFSALSDYHGDRFLLLGNCGSVSSSGCASGLLASAEDGARKF